MTDLHVGLDGPAALIVRPAKIIELAVVEHDRRREARPVRVAQVGGRAEGDAVLR